MSKLSSISILFCCKWCSSCSFPSVDEFIEHKEQHHLSEFKSIKCIVFEEQQQNVVQDSGDISIPNNSVNESSQLFESLLDELNFDRNGREPLLIDLPIGNLAKLSQNPPSVIVTNSGPILRLRSQGSLNSTCTSTRDVSDSVSAPNVMVNIKREPETDEFSNVDSYAQGDVNTFPAPAFHGDSITNNSSSINTYESTNPLLDNLIANAPIKIEPSSIQIHSSDIENPVENTAAVTDHLFTNDDANNNEYAAMAVNDASGSGFNFNLQDLKPVLLGAAASDVNFDLLLHFQTDSNSKDNEFGVNWPTPGTPRTEYEPLLPPPLPKPPHSINSKPSCTPARDGSSILASVKVEVDQEEESEVDSDSDSDSDTADATDDPVASHRPPGFFGGEHSLSMSTSHGDQSISCFSNELGPSASSSSESASSTNYSLVSSSQPHRDRGNIRCPYCAKEKFYTEGPSEKSHMLKFHSDLKIQCSICRVQNLFWPSSMEKHIANSHNPTRANFMCSRCSRNMKNATTLKRHQKGCINKLLLPGFEDTSPAS